MMQIFGEYILSPLGGTVRWIYGSIWRSIAGKKKYSWNEYMNGPKNGDPFIDTFGHEFNNRIIGFVTLFFIIFFLVNNLVY